MKTLLLLCLLATGCAACRPPEAPIEDWCDELRIRSALYDWCLKGGCSSETWVRRYHERVRVGIELCGAQLKSAEKPKRAE